MNGKAADQLKIRDLHYRYCYCLDDGRIDEFVDLFREDATLTLGSDELSGQKDIRTFVRERTESDLLESVHMAANPVVDVDGNEAEARWYYVAMKQFEDGSSELGIGSHEATYCRTDDGWKIAAMSATRLQTVEFGT